jgi:hypothetical protein
MLSAFQAEEECRLKGGGALPLFCAKKAAQKCAGVTPLDPIAHEARASSLV